MNLDVSESFLTYYNLVTTPDSFLLIWYIIMTLFNVGNSVLLFISFKLSQCDFYTNDLYTITIWIEIVL